MHRHSRLRLLKKHRAHSPCILLHESTQLAVAKGNHLARTNTLSVLIDHMVDGAQCKRPGTLRIGEHVQTGDIKPIDKTPRLLKQLLSLAARTHHQVHTYESIRNKPLYHLHLVGK